MHPKTHALSSCFPAHRHSLQLLSVSIRSSPLGAAALTGVSVDGLAVRAAAAAAAS